MRDEGGGGVNDDDITLVGSDWRPPEGEGEPPQPSWAGTQDYLHPGPEVMAPRRGGSGTRRTRASRRRAVRRRRLAALAVVVLIVAVAVFLIVRGCGGDPFVGTWAKHGSGTVVISQGDDGRYSVAFGTKAGLPAKRAGDRLTVTRKQNGKRVTIRFTPGAQADTLEEHFPDGTTDVLKRQ